MKVGIYVRVSGKSNKQTTENQTIALKDYCRRQGWNDFEVYEDRQTGTKSNRTAFQRIMLDASQRKIDVVLFWALDRLSREGVLATLQHLQALDRYGVAWKSYTEAYLDSSVPLVKDIVVSILAAIAKNEHERISERVRAGLHRAKRQGIRLGRPERIVSKDKVIALRAAGKSMREIAVECGVSVWKIHSLLHAGGNND